MSEEKDYQTQYNELMTQMAEQQEKLEFAKYNITNITNMILIPHYTAEAEMRWQDEYPRDSEEFKEHVEYDVNSAKLWIDTYVGHREALEIRRPTHNPEDPAWDVLESDLAFIQQNYPDIPQSLSSYVDEDIAASLELERLQAEFLELTTNNVPIAEEPVIDTASKMQEIEETTTTQVEAVTSTPEPDGHVYPVALVQGWTNEMKNYNEQLSQYMIMLNAINFDKVDRMWLKNQVLKFVTWLKGQLKKLKEKIVKGLKGMSQPIKKAMNLIKPIIEPPSLTTIISWASGIISIFMEPYQKVIQFISDFATYTPPLVAEAGKLAVNVATVPVKITTKTQELQGEGSEVIKEEIANAVGGVAFEPPSMGDLQ